MLCELVLGYFRGQITPLQTFAYKPTCSLFCAQCSFDASYYYYYYKGSPPVLEDRELIEN
jgi:hypothetical protein